MTNINGIADEDGAIFIVITPEDSELGGIGDMEVLDEPPRWDLSELGQICYIASINGGDSRRVF